jgi:hypothetical protein
LFCYRDTVSQNRNVTTSLIRRYPKYEKIVFIFCSVVVTFAVFGSIRTR